MLALWNFLRWLMLEAKGMEWATIETGGDRAFRVTYRRGGGEGLVSLATREQRGVEELDYGRKRRGPVIVCWIVLVAAFLVRTVAYEYSEYLGWAVTYLVLPLFIAKAGTEIIYSLAYRAGAQFIPGAKVLDAPPERFSPEVLKAEMPWDASFEATEAVVIQMGGGNNRS